MKTNYKWFEHFNKVKFFSTNDVRARESIACMCEQGSLAMQLLHQMDEFYASAVMDGFGLVWDFYNDETDQKAEFRAWAVDGGDELPIDWHPGQTNGMRLVLRVPTKTVFDNTEDNPNVLKLSGAIERIQFGSASKKTAAQALEKAARLPEPPTEIKLSDEQITGGRMAKKDPNAKPLTNEEVKDLIKKPYDDTALVNTKSVDYFNLVIPAHREILMAVVNQADRQEVEELIGGAERVAGNMHGMHVGWELKPKQYSASLNDTGYAWKWVLEGYKRSTWSGARQELIGWLELDLQENASSMSLLLTNPKQVLPVLSAPNEQAKDLSPMQESFFTNFWKKMDEDGLLPLSRPLRPGSASNFKALGESMREFSRTQAQQELLSKMQAQTPTQFVEELKALGAISLREHQDAVRAVVVNNFVFNGLGHMFKEVEREVGDYLDRNKIEGASILWRFDYDLQSERARFNCYTVTLDEEELAYELMFKLFSYTSPFDDQRKKDPKAPWVVGFPLVLQTNCLPGSEFSFRLNGAGWWAAMEPGTPENIKALPGLNDRADKSWLQRNPSFLKAPKWFEQPYRHDGEPMTIDDLYKTREERFNDLSFAEFSSLWRGVEDIANMPYFSLDSEIFQDLFIEHFIDVSPTNDRNAQFFLAQLKQMEKVWQQRVNSEDKIRWDVQLVTRHPNNLLAQVAMMVQGAGSTDSGFECAYAFNMQLRYDWPEGCGNPAVKFTEFVPEQWNVLFPAITQPLIITHWGGFEPVSAPTKFHNLYQAPPRLRAVVGNMAARYRMPELFAPKLWTRENSGLMKDVFSSDDDSATVHFTSYHEVKHLFERMREEAPDYVLAIAAMEKAIVELNLDGTVCFTLEAVGPKGGDAATILLRAMMKQGGACIFTAQMSIVAPDAAE